MEYYERQLDLTDTMIQELLWHALTPDGLTMLRTFKGALEQLLQSDPLPEGVQLSGISVVTGDNRVYAELTYTAVG